CRTGGPDCCGPLPAGSWGQGECDGRLGEIAAECRSGQCRDCGLDPRRDAERRTASQLTSALSGTDRIVTGPASSRERLRLWQICSHEAGVLLHFPTKPPITHAEETMSIRFFCSVLCIVLLGIVPA